MTLLGFLFVLLAYGMVVVWVPDLVGPAPSRAFYVVFAGCLWIYSTMDNIDGKQARRTGSASPLGELFDHGCDALNCPLACLVQIAAMGLGPSGRALLVLFISTWGFYLPTWEEYHTGVLYLGVVNGPTEGLLAAMGMMLVSAALGPQVWLQPVAWVGRVVPRARGAVLADLVIGGFLVLFAAYYVPSCLLSVRRACARTGSSFWAALGQLAPMLYVTVAVGLWLGSPLSHAQRDHFLLFFTAAGVAFGKMATKIIYAYVAKCPFPRMTGLMLPLLCGALVLTALSGVLDAAPAWLGAAETAYLWAYLGVCVVGYSNWIYHTISSICGHCDIYCLQIKQKRAVAPEPGARASSAAPGKAAAPDAETDAQTQPARPGQ